MTIAMNQERIAAAAAICLETADVTKQPFRQVADFIASLKTDPAWTNDEIIEVQTRIIRALMRRSGMDK